jgi:hypothetical protein
MTELHPGHISWVWRFALVVIGLWFGLSGVAILANWKGATKLHAILSNPWWRLLSGDARARQISWARWSSPIGVLVGLGLIGLGIHG